MIPQHVRELALALPETEEKGHFGNADFRTRNKIFCTLQAEQYTAVLKLPLEDQEAVTTLQPEVFELGGWSHQGWTKVDLTQVDAGEFRALMVLAWKKLATKRAIKAFEAQDPNLLRLLTDKGFAGSNLDLERDSADFGRDIDLSED